MSSRRLIVTTATLVLTAAAAAIAPSDDGLSDGQRRAVGEQVQRTASAGVDRDVLIVDTEAPRVVFGMYRASQMTEPGWDLYSRCVSWAVDFRDPATLRVFLATYNGTLDNQYSAERDGIAVYNHLITNMGFLASNVDVFHQAALETASFTAYDLVIYAWIYPRSALNVVESGKPFVTACVQQSDEMGVGDGSYTMHESRNFAYVHDNLHYVTQPYPLGLLTLQQSMWMDATNASGSGRVLIAADPAVVSETICPDAPGDFLKSFGGPVTGDALDLCDSDDVRLSVRQSPPPTVLLPFIRLEYWAHTSLGESRISSLEYSVEGHVTANVGGGQNPDTLRTAIRNYAAGAFELIDQRATPTNTDVVITHVQTANAADYVGPGDGEIRVRQDVFDPGSVAFPLWFLNVDAYAVIVTN